MIQRDGNKLVVQGVVTIENVVKITQQGIALLNENDIVVDLEKVTEVDSSIVSMLLVWLRNARHHKHQLSFKNMPQNLTSLIQLYGITELIQLSGDNHNQSLG